MDPRYKALIESVKLWCLPYREQQTFFPDFVDKPFEIVDAFSKAVMRMPDLIEDESISRSAIAHILNLYFRMSLTADHPDLRDLDEQTFEHRSEWNEIRELARKTLAVIGEPEEKPDKNYI